MKQLLLIIFLLSAPLLHAQEYAYTNTEHNYSLILTGQWLRIPDETILEKEAYLKAVMGLPIDYETGFYLKGTEPFTASYFLLQYNGVNNGDFDSQVEQLKSGKVIKEITNDLMEKNLIESYDENSIYVDKENKIVYMYSTMTANGLTVKGAGAMMLGGKEIIQVLFFDMAENFDSTSHYFYEAVNSFKFSE